MSSAVAAKLEIKREVAVASETEDVDNDDSNVDRKILDCNDKSGDKDIDDNNSDADDDDDGNERDDDDGDDDDGMTTLRLTNEDNEGRDNNGDNDDDLSQRRTFDND